MEAKRRDLDAAIPQLLKYSYTIVTPIADRVNLFVGMQAASRGKVITCEFICGMAIRRDGGGTLEWDRHRQNQAASVVGMFTDEVDSTGCKELLIERAICR